MKLKPNNCRSISIIKGQVTDQRFHVGGTPVPTISEMPVKQEKNGVHRKLFRVQSLLHFRDVLGQVEH